MFLYNTANCFPGLSSILNKHRFRSFKIKDQMAHKSACDNKQITVRNKLLTCKFIIRDPSSHLIFQDLSL